MQTNDILYEDQNWLVVQKPTGMPIQNLIDWMTLHWGQSLASYSKLDRETSGLCLFSKTKFASVKALEIHESNMSMHDYLFLTDKKPKANNFTIDIPIEDRPASTEFEVQTVKNGITLIRASSRLVRKNQIRIHASRAGIPILGDAEQGGLPFPRLALHAHRLSWPDITATLESPTPHSFDPGLSEQTLSLRVAEERRQQLISSVTNCFRRLNFGELPELQASLDQFGEHLLLRIPALRSANTDDIKKLARELLQHFQASGLVVQWTADSTADRMILGKPPEPWFTVQEHGVNYSVTLTENAHTGLFLDQRDNRRRVQIGSKDARVANLFAFTCSFTCAAIHGGASFVQSVDRSKEFLRWGQRNLELNFPDLGGKSKFAIEDTREWIQRQLRNQKPKFDLMICDPPTFGPGRGRDAFRLETEVAALVQGLRSCLTPEGKLLFAFNNESMPQESVTRFLEEEFASASEIIACQDFPRLESTHRRGMQSFLCQGL